MADETPSQIPTWLSNILEQQSRTMASIAQNQEASMNLLNERLSQMERERATEDAIPDPAPTPQTSMRTEALPVTRTKARLPHPDKFDGSDKTAFPQFEGSLRAKLSIDSDVIGGEEEKVWYAFGRLSGDASVRIFPWMSYAQRSGQFTVTGIFEQMSIAFRDPRHQQKALDQLNRTKQGKKNFGDFMNEFNRLLLEAEGWGWEDAVKKGFLKAALTLELRRAMVGVIESKTYEAYCSQLRTVDDQLEQVREISTFRQGWRKRTDDVKSSSASTDAMDWQPTSVSVARVHAKEPRWASEDEIACRRQEGLCLRCGRKGHRVKECKAELPKGRKEVRVAPVRTEPSGKKDNDDPSDVEESGKE